MTERVDEPRIDVPGPAETDRSFDPLRFCIFTTIALIAWIITPAATVVIFSGFGLVAYARARRRGLLQSRCYLGDTRLVMLYLGAAFILGSVFTIRHVAGLLT